MNMEIINRKTKTIISANEETKAQNAFEWKINRINRWSILTI